MQFASVLLNQPSDAINQGQQPPMAVYFGAHDPRAESKGFCTAVSGDSASFQVGATPPGAGIPAPIIPYTVAYPVVVAPLRGSWWDAAQMYRQWVCIPLCFLDKCLGITARDWSNQVGAIVFCTATTYPTSRYFPMQSGLRVDQWPRDHPRLPRGSSI